MEGVVVQEKIDEAGARNLHFGDRIVRRQQLHQGWASLRGFWRVALRQTHGEIAGEVAMLRIARILDLDADLARGARHQVFRQCIQRVLSKASIRVFKGILR